MDHKQIKLLLRGIGLFLLLSGITLCIIGFMNFGNFESDLFMLTILGFPCIAFGIGMIVFSFSQNIARFIKNEYAPVVNEWSKDISPALENYASAIKDGLFNNDEIICTCGKRNQKDDKFCSECGKALQSICSACGKVIETDNKFCSACGQKLE